MSAGHYPAAEVLYHRVKGTSSISADADDNLADFQRAYDAYRTICARWPVPEGSRTALYRRYMILMHDLVCAHLAAGRLLPHLYYERTLAVLYAGYTGVVDDDEIPRHLDSALTTPHEQFATPPRRV
jgi:hypothetical protein